MKSTKDLPKSKSLLNLIYKATMKKYIKRNEFKLYSFPMLNF